MTDFGPIPEIPLIKFSGTEEEQYYKRLQLLQYYLSIPNLQTNLCLKYVGLKGLGYSDREIKKLCKPKPIDHEAMIKEMSEQLVRDRKIWNQGNKKHKTQKFNKHNKNVCKLD